VRDPPITRVTLIGDKEHVSPVDGDVEELRFTVPVKPFTDEIVIVAVAVEPAFVAKLDGLAAIEKSGTAML
jgi:hypothetical protein